MSNPIIAYRNPLEMWFWEGGWIYIVVSIAVVVVLFFAWAIWDECKDTQRRKQRWMEMSDGQRAAWRYYNQRNNIEAKEWEK